MSTDDFRAPSYGDTFRYLETFQTRLFDTIPAFHSADYPWERDALHQWSRCFEYPYVLTHLRARRADLGEAPVVVDLGSGVTFFPFVLAHDGWDVVCVDSDPVAVRGVARVAAALPAATGAVRSLLSSDQLPLRDASADALYSISVLEHVADPLPLVAECARVLRDGGIFVLTMDVDLTGRGAIDPAVFRSLLGECDRYFERRVPETTTHPLRLLDNFSGPHAASRQGQVPGLMLRGADGSLRPLLGGPIAAELVHLACYVAVYTRRNRA